MKEEAIIVAVKVLSNPHLNRIATTAGETALNPLPRFAFGIKVFAPVGTVYCATKAAVRTLSEGLRAEVHGDGIRTTIISPDAVDSEFKASTSNEASSKAVNELCRALIIPANSIARAIAYAFEQPADVDINEIVVRLTPQDF